MTIRVLIADDQEMVRRGLRRILESRPDIEVVGEAADGVAALEAARALRPDVALVDIRMPRMDGLEVTRRLAGAGSGPGTGPGTGTGSGAGTGPAGGDAEPLPKVRVVVVTTFDLDEYVYPALRHGACGFLLKRSGPALLIEAVRAAVAGDSLISPSITVRLLKHVTGSRPAAPRALEALTERETEIAGQVAAGLTNADIARELFISPGTVKTHVASIQRKLGVRNRVGIAVHAWEMGYAGREAPRW
ncbi:DNA-binding response regulator [Streptomyces albofaciens JCM 4342]|uniref:response regulator n=1 Tax=Streptomyces albofaciens TaxID=66866 RepID=UPI00123A2353|nr:response regulator transcription factor [Streptomyces albofaciens]KAA6214816.1 DNA-binding response regulator [Streptomyces albofaciens JCM 4342]